MKKYITEAIGTFFLVLVVSLSGGNPVAVGALLTAMVYMGGYISGGHYNPAVTLAVHIRGGIDQKTAVRYALYQLLGAILGAVAYEFIKGSTFVAAPAAESTILAVFLVELFFTFALATVVLHTATSAKVKGNDYYGLAIGLVLTAGIFAGGNISGGVYNPAVALGTNLVDYATLSSHLTNLAVYLVAQLAGGALAAVVYKKNS